jgi:hypothetical protein
VRQRIREGALSAERTPVNPPAPTTLRPLTPRPGTEVKINPIEPPRMSRRQRLRWWWDRVRAWRDPEGYLRERGITVVTPTPRNVQR